MSSRAVLKQSKVLRRDDPQQRKKYSLFVTARLKKLPLNIHLKVIWPSRPPTEAVHMRDERRVGGRYGQVIAPLLRSTYYIARSQVSTLLISHRSRQDMLPQLHDDLC